MVILLMRLSAALMDLINRNVFVNDKSRAGIVPVFFE